MKAQAKMSIATLIIEVTRRCNMSCAHCLRGEAQNLNINLKNITALLEQTEYISSITFTGGEPSLNVKAIQHTLDEMRRLDVGLDSFYIATNGKKITRDFVMVCLDLYSYSDEHDMCVVDVSNDTWHREWGDYNTSLLDGLAFFRRKHEEEGAEYMLIDQGRTSEGAAWTRHGSRKLEDYGFEIDGDYVGGDSELYLNARGYVISGCNWSYKSQNSKKICKATDNILSALKEAYPEED